MHVSTNSELETDDSDDLLWQTDSIFNDTFSSTPDPPEDEEPDKKWLLPLLISVGGVVALALVVVLGFMLYRKYRCCGRQMELAKPIRKLSMVSNISASISTTCSSGSAGRRKVKKHCIPLNQLEARIGRLSENSNSGFSAEFQVLKQHCARDIPTTAALQSQNVLKNRFSNILPYEHTRFILQKCDDETTSDYINANWMSGFEFEKEFIATQGPLENTVKDFWRMCWESKAAAVVMLTKCYEKGQEKCYPYWPTENGWKNYGGIRITLEKQTAFRIESHVWLVSELEMEKNEETRHILHFIFWSWPDFGVVDPPHVLVSFLKYFRQRVPHAQDADNVNSIVIHCSAGVGRSGVFICLDYLLQQVGQSQTLENSETSKPPEQFVNIFKLVSKLRRDRAAMVQSLQQYIFIYKCLLSIVNPTEIPEPTVIDGLPEEFRQADGGLVNLTTGRDISNKNNPTKSR